MVNTYQSIDEISKMINVKISSMTYHQTDNINELKVAFFIGMESFNKST